MDRICSADCANEPKGRDPEKVVKGQTRSIRVFHPRKQNKDV